VGCFEGFGDLPRERKGLGERQASPLRQDLLEGRPFDQFEHQRGSAAKIAGSTLTATSRPSFSSRARYTSPMPPAPSRDVT
jgi:hypothetical protein